MRWKKPKATSFPTRPRVRPATAAAELTFTSPASGTRGVLGNRRRALAQAEERAVRRETTRSTGICVHFWALFLAILVRLRRGVGSRGGSPPRVKVRHRRGSAPGTLVGGRWGPPGPAQSRERSLSRISLKSDAQGPASGEKLVPRADAGPSTSTSLRRSASGGTRFRPTPSAERPFREGSATRPSLRTSGRCRATPRPGAPWGVLTP